MGIYVPIKRNVEEIGKFLELNIDKDNKYENRGN